jgi:diaminopimelate decarboxylase
MASSDDILWHREPKYDFRALAERYATPFYLYDADAINARVRAVREAFDDEVKVYYAVKSNPNLELLRTIRDVADGLDISSGGELQQALAAGYAGAGLSFAGPAKTDTELSASIKHGVGCISVESLRELDICLAIAHTSGRRANVVLRVNPEFLNRAFGMKMGGRAMQFGIDEEELGGITARIEAHTDLLNFRGVHVYAGSQCFDAEGVAEGVENTFRIVETLEAGSTLRCSVVNLGGGFGYSHTKSDTQLDLGKLAARLLPPVRDFRRRGPVEREVVFELGRYLSAPAGVYVTRVLSAKVSRGKQFYLVDGGLHHHLAAAGTFGTALRANFVLRNLSRPDAEPVRCHIAGPSCNPTDLLAVDAELPRPELNDLIGVLNSGSYGFTASPLLFLGRSTPVELVHYNGEILLGRRAHSLLDFN